MHSFRHQALNCRVCGSVLDAASRVQDAVEPYDGAASICFNCGEVSIFVIGAFGVALREPTTQELAELASDPEYREMRALLSQYRAQHPPRE